MKKALISPMEPRNDNEGNTGYRVAFVADKEFDVAPPLFWVECSDSCVQDMWVYVDGQLVDITPIQDTAPVEIVVVQPQIIDEITVL